MMLGYPDFTFRAFLLDLLVSCLSLSIVVFLVLGIFAYISDKKSNGDQNGL